MKTKKNLLDKMKSTDTCRAAVEWVESQEGTAQEIWDRCERGDWMMWFAAKIADRRLVGLAACACARESLKYVPAGEDRPLICIETTEAYWNGKATVEEVRKARDNAAAADVDYVSDDADAGVCADIVRTFIPEVPL